MTTPRYPQGCAAGSQVRGDAGSARSFFYVNMNNGNVNNNNANNRLRSRPVRRAAPASECQGEISVRMLYDCMRAARRKKKPNVNQLKFELHWMENLIALQKELNTSTWHPRPSTSFVAVQPKARQIHAPDFADMVVHHLVVPKLDAIYEPSFIDDSYANRRGKGTHAAVAQLGKFVRQVASGQGGGWYLQLDIHNFFYSINRRILWAMLKKRLVREGISKSTLHVVHALLAKHAEQHGVVHLETAADRLLIPRHKRLENSAPDCGLPIGNLSSQFFANVYMNELDQFVKHELKSHRYLRYVDDFVLVHRDRAQLERWLAQIEQFLVDKLQLKLKPDIRVRPLSAGCDFLGYVVFPTHTRVRARVLRHAQQALSEWRDNHVRNGVASATPEQLRQLSSRWASYRGHLKHANSHQLTQHILARQPWLASLTSTRRRFSYALEGQQLSISVRSSRSSEVPMSIGSYHSTRPPVEGCPQPDEPWRDPAPAPRPKGLITCDTCAHFRPSAINPTVAMGSCAVSSAMWHAHAPHRCADFKPING
jgi:RNA-directed DNA polymerase